MHKKKKKKKKKKIMLSPSGERNINQSEVLSPKPNGEEASEMTSTPSVTKKSATPSPRNSQSRLAGLTIYRR